MQPVLRFGASKVMACPAYANALYRFQCSRKLSAMDCSIVALLRKTGINQRKLVGLVEQYSVFLYYKWSGHCSLFIVLQYSLSKKTDLCWVYIQLFNISCCMFLPPGDQLWTETFRTGPPFEWYNYIFISAEFLSRKVIFFLCKVVQ